MPTDLSIIETSVLAALQIIPGVYALIRREGLLLATHLLGLFLFTTWKKFFMGDDGSGSTELLILSTLALFAGYFFIRLTFPKRLFPIPQVSVSFPKLWVPLLCMLLLLLNHSIFNMPSLTIAAQSIQFVLASFLILHRGRFEYLSKGVVLVYFFLYFLIRVSTQLGLELVLMAFLALVLTRSKSLIPFLAAFSLLVVFLEMFKPSYREILGDKQNSPIVDRLRIFRQSLYLPPHIPLPKELAQHRLSIAGEPSTPKEEYPSLTEERVRRTIFPKQVGFKELHALGLSESYTHLLFQHMALLVLPRSVINPLIALEPTEDKRKSELKFHFIRSLQRVGDESLEHVLFFTPHLIPFSSPDTYKALLTIFVPRMVWKQKPTYGIWHEFGRKYYLIQPRDHRTSVSFTYITEAYMTFGITGIIFVGITVGCLLALFESVAQTYLILILFASAIALPFDSFSLTSKVLHRSGLLLFILCGFYWVAKGWERVGKRLKGELRTAPG